MSVLAVVALAAFYGWRYSPTSVDPDWAYFNLYAFTGSLYGRDFADCKTPGVHIWYWLLSKLVGVDVKRVKFVDHFLVSLAGLALLPIGLPYALAFVVLVNSGWLMAFHGNVGRVPAALIVIALVSGWQIAVPLWILAVLYEPKLIPALAVYAYLSAWWPMLLLVPLAVGTYLVFRKREWFGWIWESSVLIPLRMARNRTLDLTFFPWFTSNGLLYVLPWVVFTNKDFRFWLPAIAFAALTFAGKVVRPNHLIPLVAWLCLASPSTTLLLLCAVDLLSSGLYFGNIWGRWYGALDDMNKDAEDTGKFLRDQPGSLYMNGIHSGVYLHSGKPVPFGFTEQVEIQENVPDRKMRMIERWQKEPPNWVVSGELPAIRFKPLGYEKVATFGRNVVFKRA